MDRQHIENENIVERYLSGDLTVREAREFENYCRDRPEFLKELPIPVRLKTRLARRPLQESETGMFAAIPSSVTHAAVEAADDDFEPENDARRHSSGVPATSRVLIAGLLLALVGAVAGVVVYGMRANALSKEVQSLRQDARVSQVQAPGSVQVYRVAPVRAKPENATLEIGWPSPPQLIELHIDVSQGRYSQFQLTIDNVEAGRLIQIRRVARDSNRELRLGINSSAFGPGEYLVKIEGHTWRGQTQEVGWVRMNMRE